MVVMVLFGGGACEHDISVITGMQVLRAARGGDGAGRDGVALGGEVLPVYINERGEWLVGRGFGEISTFSREVRGNSREVRGKRVHLRPNSKFLFFDNGRRFRGVDVAVLCLHGMGGEDGTVAAVLELAGIPYTGANVRASAVGMDKITTKFLLMGHGLPVTPFIALDKYDYTYNLFEITDRIKNELKFPLIVKPSNLGSSIGISLAHDFVELISSMSIAFKWDSRIIVEEALTNFTELNCAVLGYGADITISELEKPLGWTDFLSFEDKYKGGFKGKAKREFPAVVPETIRNEVRALAAKTFKAVDASGVARVDFLLKDDKIYVNEINTIPGSLAFYLFAPALSFTALLEKLIALAFKAHRDKTALSKEITPLLSDINIGNGAKSNKYSG